MPETPCRKCGSTSWSVEKGLCSTCRRDEWAAKLRAVIAELGPDWTVEEEAERQWLHARLGEMVISFTFGFGRDGKTHCSPAVPRPADTGYAYCLRSYGVIAHNEKGPEAYFDPDRPPAAIARDVLRRVVEPYAAMLPRILEKKLEIETAAANAEGLARRLGKILGMADWAEWNKRSGRGDVWHVHGRGANLPSFEISKNGSVQIKGFYVSGPDAAVHIAEALAAIAAGKRTITLSADTRQTELAL